MKKILFIFALPSMFFMTSCGDTEKTDETTNDSDSTTVEVDASVVSLKGLREFDLSEHDINAIIYIPEEYHKDEDGKEWFNDPIIKHNEGEAKWEITMPRDKHWNMVIEDWGDDERNVGIERTEHVDDGHIFDFIYDLEGDDYLLYSRILKQENTTISPEDAKTLPNYHFYYNTQIDGGWITIRSFTMDDFRRISALKMLNAARSIRSSK